MIALSLRNLHKRFDARRATITAIQNVSLQILQGSVVALLGENGAGKSTLIRLCAGLLWPDSGEIAYFDRESRNIPNASLAAGVLLEGNRNLYWRLSPLENMEYFAGLKGMRRPDARKKALDLLERFDLVAKRDEPVQTLSRGMQQRLALMCALLHEPSVIFLDEPSLGLDLGSSKTISEVIRELSVSGATIVLSTHHFSLLEDVATDVALLKRGELVLFDKIQTFLGERREGFSVFFDRDISPESANQLVLEIPGVRICGKQLSFDGEENLIPIILEGLAQHRLVSISRIGSTLEEAFQRATTPVH
jgi:ABC-2 type transport system ATP-binding protein